VRVAGDCRDSEEQSGKESAPVESADRGRGWSFARSGWQGPESPWPRPLAKIPLLDGLGGM